MQGVAEHVEHERADAPKIVSLLEWERMGEDIVSAPDAGDVSSGQWP